MEETKREFVGQLKRAQQVVKFGGSHDRFTAVFGKYNAPISVIRPFTSPTEFNMSKHSPVGTDSTPEQVLDLKPRKSKKRSKHAAHSEPITNTIGTSAPVEDDPSLEDRLKEKARKKEVRVHSTKFAEDLPAAEVPEAPKKSKKRKYQSGENVDQPRGKDLSKSENDRLPDEPPKKKHKNRTEFSDPRVDVTLNNQSRKGA